MWNTETFHPSSSENEMELKIKILRQTIVRNEVAKVDTVHSVPKHIAHMHVSAGNAEYLEETATNRAIGVEGSDSKPKRRKKK